MQIIERLFWWLAPLLGLVLVLVTSYQAVTTRRFDDANGVTGELLSGSSVGQTFVARYDSLSGVELHLGTYATGTGPARASLVLHLREGPSVAQGVPGRDLATARLPAGSPLTENSWYLFSFPPINDSQDRPFYIEVESPDGAPGRALTLYWWHPNPGDTKSDPYADGRAYLNGQPRRGDIAFGLHYEASPISVAGQVTRAISANLPGPAMLLLFGGAMVALGALLYLLTTLRELAPRRRWLRRWSLPFVLGLTLLSGLLYLFLLPPWQGPDEHAHFAYSALLDRYNLDYAQVEAIYQQRRAPDKALTDAINASMARHDFTRLFGGTAEPGAPPDAGATLYSALGKPPAYYWLGAVALRFARLLGIDANPYTDPDASLLVLRSVSLALDMLVVALAWLAARIISVDDGSWLILLLPLTVALLPMHTFDTTMFNNDVLAEVAVSAIFVVLAALLRWPTGWRAVALAVLAVLLAVGGLFTKSTAEAALPLLAAGFLAWIGLLVTIALNRRAIRRTEGKGLRTEATPPLSSSVLNHQSSALSPLLVPGVMVGLLAVLGLGTLLVAYVPQDQTAGWVTSWVPLQPVPRTATPTAHDGRFVLDLGPRGHQVTLARQTLLPPVYHPVMTATVSGWVRTAPGAGKPLVQSPLAVMIIASNGSQISHSNVPLKPNSVWQPISTTAHLVEGAQQITLLLTSADQKAQFDDFTLQVDEGAVVWHDPIFQPTLVNPSAESGFVGLRPELARLLPVTMVAVAEVMPNPQPFDKLALWGYYANGQYASFWGNFGWLSIPLPDSLYTVLTIISVLALTGLAVGLVARGWGLASLLAPSPQPLATSPWFAGWLGFVALFSLVATVVVSYAWQTMLLATQNQTAALSGRYLFVLIIPIAWLLLAGLDTIFILSRFAASSLQD